MTRRHIRDRSRTREDAAAAIKDAEATLTRLRAQRQQVSEQAATMRAHRIENHFAEKIRLAMGGQP